MKLLTNGLAAATAKVSSSGTGKRKKKQLLLEPPTPPPELRGVNDDDDEDCANRTTRITFANSSSSSYLVNNKQKLLPASSKKRTNTWLPSNRQSIENLKSRHINNGHTHTQQLQERLTSTDSKTTNSGAANDNNNQTNSKTTSVIHQSNQNRTAAGRRRKFEDLRQYFDFNRMQLGTAESAQVQQSTASATTTLMMASRERKKDHHFDHTTNHHHHNHHHLNNQRQPDQSQMATAKSSRRKSELTSFLTILFGSMLAVLLLASNQIMCDQTGHPTSGTRNTTQAVLLDHRAIGANQNETNFDNGKMHLSLDRPTTATTVAGETAETAVTLEPSETSVTFAHDVDSTSTSSTGVTSGNNNDDDYDDANDSANSATKTKLGDLLVDTARDATDLLINRLQSDDDKTMASSNNGADSGSDEATATEPQTGGDNTRDVNASDDNTNSVAEQGHNSTEHVASPLSATDSTSSTTKPEHGLNGGTHDDEDAQTKFALETYAKWRAAGDDIIELFSRKLMPIIIEHGYDVDSSTVAGLLQAFNGVRQLKPWALKVLDAWTKLSPGVLLGTQSDFGDFDECINIRVDDPNGLAAANSEHFPNDELDPLTGLKTTTLVGRYCLADVEFPKPARRRVQANQSASTSPTWPYEPIELRKPLMDFAELPAYKDTIFVETGNFFNMLYVDPIRVGICLTNKIDPLSFQQVFNKLVEEFRVKIDFKGRCVTKYDRQPRTTYQQVSAYVLLVACSLVLLSTGYDLLLTKLNKLPCPRSWFAARRRLQLSALKYRDVFTSFSLIRNTKRLFKPSNDARPAQSQSSAANLNLHHHHHQATCPALLLSAGSSCTGASSVATTSSSIADSSVESSPSIERRSSSETTTSSMRDLISLKHTIGTSDKLHNHRHQHQIQSATTCCCDNSSSSSSAAAALSPNKKDQPTHAAPHVSLLSLHGIRVITMVWMIVNHTYMFGGFFVLWAHRRLIDIAEWPKSLSFQMVLNGWLTVETYFFLSAMIIVLNVLPLMRARKFNYFFYILHRLLRLLPAYIGLVCLNFLWPLISSGPVWLVKGKSFVQDPCEQYLWTNFLFINNWIWPEKQCMVHTWFLSADFQLYVLAPVIVYLLYRRPALGHSMNLLVAVLASILSGFVIYANKLLPTTLINKLEFDAIKQQLSYSYFATYQHMGPYCLGLLVGYLLHKRPHARLPKHLTWLLWLLLPPLSFTTLLLTYLWNGAYPEANLINPSPLVSALYVAIHRTIWSALIAWIVFACATGRAKLLANFLSNPIFLPISRLSYSIYLVHLPVIMFRALNLRHTLEWTDQNILWEACGNFIVSSLLGFFLNVAFESPVINLENALFKRNCTNSSAILSPSSKQTASDIYHRSKLVGLTTGHPDKQQSCENAPITTTLNTSSQRAYSTSSNSSDGCDDSMAGSVTHQTDGRVRKSLRPKQSASVEQIFGRAAQTGTDHMHLKVPELDVRSNTGQQTNHMSTRRKQHKQNEIDMLDHEHHNVSHEGHQKSAGSSLSEQIVLPPTSAGQATRQRSQDRYKDNPDDLYSIAAEYRHYAPGSYQQWRRAVQQLDLSNQHHHHQQQQHPLANSTSMRSMQYATLARTSRPRQDGHPVEMGHQYGLNQRPFQEQDHYQLDRPYQQQQQFAVPYNDHHKQMAVMSRHDRLFPNSSELSFGHDVPGVGRSALMHQRQMLASRRHHGRYNTLTGTGSRDWRSQIQSQRKTQNRIDDAETDLINSWEQQQPWTAASGIQLGPAPNDGSLLIPRIDWSSTLRRQARAGASQASSSVGGVATFNQSGSLLGRQDQSDDRKIVEEPSVEGEENSAL